MYVVGLTGGIGSGKSTVARHFSELGVPVLDTDEVAREVVAPGEPVLKEIRDYFGAAAVDTNDHLNRAYLRSRIFADEAARHHLEGLLHPLIRQRCLQWLSLQSSVYAILVIPLLLEKGWQAICDRVLVVDIDEATQRQRVMARDGLAEAEVSAIMASQFPRAQRLRGADDVIINNGSSRELQAHVLRLHHTYLELAKGGNHEH